VTFVASQPDSQAPNVHAILKRLAEVKQEITEAKTQLAELNKESK